MGIRKIGVGGAFWFAGIVVPVLQHALLYIGAGAASSKNINVGNFYLLSLNDFPHTPALVSLYFIAMWIVGTVLVVSGLFSKNGKG